MPWAKQSHMATFRLLNPETLGCASPSLIIYFAADMFSHIQAFSTSCKRFANATSAQSSNCGSASRAEDVGVDYQGATRIRFGFTALDFRI